MNQPTKEKIFLIIMVILTLVFLKNIIVNSSLNPLEKKSHSIELAIEKGVQFIVQKQEPYGEVLIASCLGESLQECFPASTPFGAAQALYSLRNLPKSQTDDFTKKALSFLQEEEEEGGIWGYFGSRYKFPRENIPMDEPDLEDMALISFILRSNGIEFGDNYDLFQERRNEEGLFYTWLRGEPNQEFLIFPDEEVDCVINANVLLYLGESDPAVCSYLLEAIERKDEPCSIWYPSRFNLFYAISRAFNNGAECLGEGRDAIIEEILANQDQSGGFTAKLYTPFYGPKNVTNELETAFALNTLLNFGYGGEETEKAVEYLLKNQRQDGSWARGLWIHTFNPYSEGLCFGSEEFTTVLAIEALHAYYSNNH